MKISKLARFANVSDMKRAIRNPSKAARVIYQNAVGDPTTSVSDPSVFSEEQIVAIEDLCGVDSVHVSDVLDDLRSGAVQSRLEDCALELEGEPYSLGGMRLGGELAYLITRLTAPDPILEIGVANGVSTFYVLSALDDVDSNADVRGLDKPQFESDIRERRGERGLRGIGGIVPDGKCAGWVAPRELRASHGYQYYVGDFTETLPSIIDGMGAIGLAIYDASKDRAEMELAYETLLNALKPGGFLVSDDIDVNGAFQSVTAEYPGASVEIGGCGIYRAPTV